MDQVCGEGMASAHAQDYYHVKVLLKVCTAWHHGGDVPKDLSDPVPTYSKGNYTKGNISLWPHKLVQGKVHSEQSSTRDTMKSLHS